MLRRKYIRLFISSTFADMQVERDLLQQRVFPDMQRYCLKRGWQFDGIDLRWGVTAEASLDQRTMSICLQELHECQNVSPRPNFLVLLGDRYGWVPLPEKMSIGERDAIRAMATSEEQALLDSWYLLDANALPDGQYVLKARTKEAEVDYRDGKIYDERVYQPLHELMHRYAEQVDDERVWKRFATSATEQEIIEGALKVNDSREHIIVFNRSMKDLPKDLKATYCEAEPWYKFRKSTPAKRLKRLKEQLCGSANVVINEKLSHKEYHSDSYADRFVQAVTKALRDIVDKEISQYTQKKQYEIDREMAWGIAENYTKDMLPFGRSVIGDGATFTPEEIIGNTHPYVFVEGRGTGKTTLLSHLAMLLRKRDCDVVLRYVRLNDGIYSGMSLLNSVWDELNSLYPTKEEFNVYSFRKRLASLEVRRPLYIIIDDLLLPSVCDDILDLLWRPDALAANIFLIGSTPNPIRLADVLSVKMGMLEGVAPTAFLRNRLAVHHRTLTAEQWSLLEHWIGTANADRTIQFLMNVTILLERYRSFDRLTLPDVKTEKDFMIMLVRQMALPQFNGDFLFFIVIFMDCLRFGISIGELCRIVPTMDELWNDFVKANPNQQLCQKQLPAVVAIRALRDMSPMLYINYFRDQYLYSFKYFWHLSHELLGDGFGESIRFINNLLYKFYQREHTETGSIHAFAEFAHLAAFSSLNKLLYTQLWFLVKVFEYGLEDYILSYYDMLLDKNMLAPDESRMVYSCRALFHGIKNYLTSRKRLKRENDSIMWSYMSKEEREKADPNLPTVFIALSLAAEYAPETWMRKEADKLLAEKGFAGKVMHNTLGLPSVEQHLIRPLPQGIVSIWRLCRFWGDVIVWQEHTGGDLYFMDTHSGNKCERLNIGGIRCFDVCDGHLFVVGRDFVRFFPDQRLSNPLIWDFKIGNGQVAEIKVGCSKEPGVYAMYCRIDSKIYSLKIDVNAIALDMRRIAITIDHPFTLEGTLNDGEWIVYRQVVPAEDKKSRVDYCVFDFANLRRKDTFSTPVQYYFDGMFMASTGGQTLAMTFGNQSMYYIDYSADNPQLMRVFTSMSFGHAPVYYVNVSRDGKNILSLAGDKRLMKYQTGAAEPVFQMSLFSEISEIVADENNETVLWDSDDDAHFFNKIINLKNLHCQHDYFPPALYSLSADAKGETIVASYGYMWQFSDESAFVYTREGDSFTNRLEDDSSFGCTLPYTRATAVTADGRLYAYARGNHIFVVERATGRKRHLHFDTPQWIKEKANYPDVIGNEHVSVMAFTPDGGTLVAFVTDYGDKFSIMPNGYRNAMLLFDINDGRDTPVKEHELIHETTQTKTIHADRFRLSRDGKLAFITDNTSKKVLRINLADGSWLTKPFKNIDHLAFTPDDDVNDYGCVTAFAANGRKVFCGEHNGCHWLCCENSYRRINDVAPFALVWCADCRHLYAIAKNGCLLLDADKKLEIVQIYNDMYVGDENRDYHFGSGTGGNIIPYDKGLIYYNGVKILRLEPPRSDN